MHEPLGLLVQVIGKSRLERLAHPRSPFFGLAAGAAAGVGSALVRSAADLSRVARNSLSWLQFGHSRELASCKPRMCNRFASCAMPRKSHAGLNSSSG